MTKLISKTNLYFFGSESIEKHDAFWFYSIYGFMGIAALFILIMNVINKL